MKQLTTLSMVPDPLWRYAGFANTNRTKRPMTLNTGKRYCAQECSSYAVLLEQAQRAA